MDELQSILEAVDSGDLSALTDEQLTEAADKIKQYGLSLRKDKPTAEEIADAITLAQALSTVNEAIQIRETAAAELKAQADSAFAAFGDEPQPEVETPEVEEVAVAASRPSAAEVAKRRPPAAEPKQDERPKALVASALEGEGKMGTRFNDREELANAMYSGWDRLSNGSQTVARISIENKYKLSVDDPINNWQILQEVAAKTQQARNAGVALTAALGCAPSEPVYEFCSQSVRGAGLIDLPGVTARRGSRTYPPSVAVTALEGQAGVGTQFTGASKSCYTVNCGTTRTTDVIANYICLTFDNDEGLFYPEMVAHYNELALVVFEHAVNQRLIEGIRDSAITTTVQDLDTGGGTVIGLIRALARVRAYYIERHKMSENAVLDAILPFWFGASYAADVAARQSTDMAGAIDLSLDRIISDLRQVGINAQFVYDWQESVAAGFDDFGSALVFAPGTFVRLDGPTLDLGVVRDSTLNAANDFQNFFESWTGLAAVCDEALYVQGIETCPTGLAALTTAITCGAS